MWDDRDLLNKKLNRTMKKYACIIKHPSLEEPQLKGKKWWSAKSSPLPNDNAGLFAQEMTSTVQNLSEICITPPKKSKRRMHPNQRWRRSLWESYNVAARSHQESLEKNIHVIQKLKEKQKNSDNLIKKCRYEIKYLKHRVK